MLGEGGPWGLTAVALWAREGSADGRPWAQEPWGLTAATH
jgi:hypothetical protein